MIITLVIAGFLCVGGGDFLLTVDKLVDTKRKYVFNLKLFFGKDENYY